MKQLTTSFTFKSLMTLLMITLIQTAVWAQDGSGSSSSSSGSGSGSSSTTTTTKSLSVASNSNDWYTSPWVWVIGAAVFILLLVALMRSNSSSAATTASRTDRVTVTKSTSLD